MKKILSIILLFIAVAFIYAVDYPYEITVVADASSPDSLKNNEKDNNQDLKSFEETVKDYTLIEGLFNFYINDKNEVLMEILPEQLEKDFLLSLSRKQGDGSFFGSGDTLGDKLFFIRKIGNKIYLFEKTLNYRADEKTTIYKAIEDHIPTSIIGSSHIKSLPHPDRKSFLIEPGNIFIRDNANVNYAFSQYYKANYNLDKESSYFGKIKSFPLNSEIDVVLHFSTNNPQYSPTIPDGRSIVHTYRYSLIKIPENDYLPRFNDDRLGYFNTIYVDYNSLLTNDPYVRYINRWNLRKENPGQKVSKPVNPIIYWLDNRIPPEYRDAVRDGVLEWNKAFEKAGFKDAIVVKQMPDDADWDPEDIRYSTIQWIVEPEAGYAVGPSRVNPYTGEIFDADVKLCADIIRYDVSSYNFMILPISDKHQMYNPFSTNSKTITDNNFSEMLNNELLSGTANANYDRIFGFNEGYRNNLAFGYSLLEMRNLFGNTVDLKDYIYDAIKALVVHEVGHTLGLRHNFKASYMRTNSEMQNSSITEKDGLTSSVMDYLIGNIATEGEEQGQYFQTSLGAYDYWVIEYGYKDFKAKNTNDEKEELEKIASLSTRPEYAYGSDEDASWGNRSIDPTCTRWDMGKDILKFCENRMKLSDELFNKLEGYHLKKGKDFSDIRRGFNTALSQYWTALEAAAKFIGGVYQYRDHIGDPEGRNPYQIVEAEKQRQATEFICKYFLSEDAFSFPTNVLDKLTYSKKESFTWSPWESTRLDFPVSDVVKVYQYYALEELFDYLRLKRLQDNEVKLTNQRDKFLMDELFTKVYNEVWKELEQNKDVPLFRRNLQTLYIDKLIEISMNNQNFYPQDAANLCRLDLTILNKKLHNSIDTASNDKITLAHYAGLTAKIDAFLEAKYNFN